MNDSLMTSIFITSINHKRIRITAAMIRIRLWLMLVMTSIFITSINHKRIRIIAAVKNDANKSMRHHGD